MASGLTSSELYKEGREFRVDLFLQKFKDNIPFEMVSGPPQRLVFDQKLYDLVANRKSLTGVLFTTESGTLILTGKIAKSKEFGGGTGSGAGAASTDINESAQAVYMQAYCNKYKVGRGTKKSIGFSTEELKAAHNISNVKASIAQITALNDEWVKSSESIAMKFFSDEAKLAGNKTWTFIHGKGFVVALEKKYKELNKLSGSFFTNVNKWNPADIWALSISSSSAIEKVNKCTTLISLNSLIYDWLKDRIVIGISLKKVTATPKLEYYNFNGASDLLKQAKFTSLVSSPTSFFKSKDMYIIFNSGKIQYHNFGSSTVQGQISGTNAFGGKVGHGPTINILKQLKLNNTTDIRKKYFEKYAELLTIIRNRNSKSSSDIKKYKEVTDMLYAEYKRVTKSNALSEFAFLQELEDKHKKDGYWIFSKTITISLKNILTDCTPVKTQEFLHYSLSYAGSESLTSSAFIKIS